MENLKDYLKLIFAAVMSFIVSLLPDKRNGGKVPVEVVGNGVKEGRETGRKVYGLKEVLAAVREGKYMIDSYGLLHRKRNKTGWRTHGHKLWMGKKVSSPAFYNTG